ncbi:unnamed protein product [Cyprideis torosa]|uniref:Uncharacterized protein n=1 Tax=Cyprideis torosa TaxID=163714 RepID=A0A7R8WEV7_9CRUS|nr:unnamed protein product [Cyprideis torosa]CAG0893361.1 unnamed protein product [Cyprideis torosa]
MRTTISEEDRHSKLSQERRYQKTIATMGVEGLKLNPEVSFDPVLHSESGIPQNIRDWIQKLNLINESLSGILQSMAPPPRSLPTSSLLVPHRLAFADTIFPGAAASSLRTSGFQPVDRSSWNKDHWSQSQSPSSQNNQPRWETSRFESPKVEGSGDIWNDHFDPWRDAEDEWEGGARAPPSLWEEGSGAVDPWDTSSAAPPTTDFTIEEQPPDSQKTEKGGAEGGASITVRPMADTLKIPYEDAKLPRNTTICAGGEGKDTCQVFNPKVLPLAFGLGHLPGAFGPGALAFGLRSWAFGPEVLPLGTLRHLAWICRLGHGTVGVCLKAKGQGSST